jgi:acyl dehydratase
MTLATAQADLHLKVGKEIHVSDWLTITQDMITAFGKATGDMQWIHVDPKRAAAESPYRKTIAHGYFTLSLYPQLRGLVDQRAPIAPGVQRIINYGLNKLRFPNAVTSGSRVRGRCKLVAVETIKDSLQIIEEYTVEIEGQERPACVAEAVMRLYF